MIHYLRGDATQPQGDGLIMLVHICNNIGLWGAGFTAALSHRWPQSEKSFNAWYDLYHSVLDPDKMLGTTLFVNLAPKLQLANMVAQDGVGRHNIPIRYNALRTCLECVAKSTSPSPHEGIPAASVHMPRIGCGLAGGRWEEVAPIIEQTLVSQGREVYVYDLPGGP